MYLKITATEYFEAPTNIINWIDKQLSNIPYDRDILMYNIEYCTISWFIQQPLPADKIHLIEKNLHDYIATEFPTSIFQIDIESSCFIE